MHALAWLTRVAGRRIEYAAVTGKALHARVVALVRKTGGQAARDRHHVHLGRAFIARGKGHQLAIRRDAWLAFLRQMGGEALGARTCVATIDGGAPQVAFGDKHHRVAVNRRLPEIAGLRERGLDKHERAER